MPQFTYTKGMNMVQDWDNLVCLSKDHERDMQNMGMNMVGFDAMCGLVKLWPAEF